MKYRITHQTTYSYEQPVTSCYNEAHLIPRDGPHQRCLDYRVDVEPAPCDRTEREDFFGNRVLYFAIEEPHDTLITTAISEVAIEDNGVQLPFRSNAPWRESTRRLKEERSPANLDAVQYLLDSPMAGVAPRIKRYAATSFREQGSLAEIVFDLMARIHRDFDYDPDFTTVATPLSEVFEHRRGVCQDFAHLAIACLRSHGVPARYVSGYIETLPPSGQAKLRGADASHAWFSAYDPYVGWLDYDPTNNQVPYGPPHHHGLGPRLRRHHAAQGRDLRRRRASTRQSRR